MELEKEITFVTEEGYEYLIKFTLFPQKDFEYEIDIIDISLILMSQTIENNSLKTLAYFTNIIDAYLIENDVILYYYCDTLEIKMRENRKEKLLPQEYRSLLFSSMFNKRNFENYILKAIKISDEINGDHFISLISHINNIQKIEKIESDIQRLDK